MTQTRADMAAYIKEHKDCTLKDAEQSAFLAVEWLLNSVASGERVELRLTSAHSAQWQMMRRTPLKNYRNFRQEFSGMYW